MTNASIFIYITNSNVFCVYLKAFTKAAYDIEIYLPRNNRSNGCKIHPKHHLSEV